VRRGDHAYNYAYEEKQSPIPPPPQRRKLFNRALKKPQMR
jgi:hypothetical protein